MKRISAAFITLAILSACSTADKQNTLMEARSADAHTNVIAQYSSGEAEYSGFYNTFEYRATPLNSAVRESLLRKQADYFKWDADKAARQREEYARAMQNGFEVFLSFYTPDRQNDNLTDARSIWRVLLDTAGRRYEGRITRSRMLLAELQELYPYHTRWNTPYFVTFDVPTALIEQGPSQLTITGPLGTKTVNFPAVQ